MSTACGNRLPYAFVYIHCIQNVRFPYYLRTQHQQAIEGVTYRLRCMSYAEVDFYQRICDDLPDFLAIAAVHTADTDGFRQVINNGDFDTDVTEIRNWVDGKELEIENPLRNTYIGQPF